MEGDRATRVRPPERAEAVSEPWPQLSDETQRLDVLEALQAAAGKQPDERFDRIARMATRYLNVPIALISLIDGERQSFKAAFGLDRTDVPRGHSICAHALAGKGVLVVPDLREDARFRDYPVVREGPRARSYAGHPLLVAGRRVGTLCVMDTKVRCFEEHELAALIDLAAWAESELLADQSRHLVRELDGLQRRTEMVLEGVAEGIIGVDASGAMTFINSTAEQLLGWPPGDLIGRDMHTTPAGRTAADIRCGIAQSATRCGRAVATACCARCSGAVMTPASRSTGPQGLSPTAPPSSVPWWSSRTPPAGWRWSGSRTSSCRWSATSCGPR